MQIKDLVEGQLVDGVFAVLRKERRRTRQGAPFLVVELADRTGRIKGTVFDDVPILDGRFAEGEAVRVIGTVEEYRGERRLLVRAIERQDRADPLELVPGARRDTEDLLGFLDFLAEEIPDSTLRALVQAVHGDAQVRARFRDAPMTIDAHHAYSGGALQHTVAVASVCREAQQLHPRLDPSLLAASALVFAIGAADAFAPGAVLAWTEEGRLLGLPHLSARHVERAASRVRTPRERLLPIVHALVAPRATTPEAICLRAAIRLDAETTDALGASG